MTGHATPQERAIIDQLAATISVNESPLPDLVRLARLYVEPDHREEEAMAFLERVLERDPDYAEAKFWLAYCFRQFMPTRELMARAKSLLLDLTESPTVFAAAAWSSLPSLLADEGDVSPGERIRCYSRSVELQPAWVENHIRLANALLEIGEADNARRHAERALRNRLDAAQRFEAEVDNMFEDRITGRAWPIEEIEEETRKIMGEARTR